MSKTCILRNTVAGTRRGTRRAMRRLLPALPIVLAFATATAWADYGSLTGRSLVVQGQGITATSRVTEVVRFDISETNTDDIQTPQFDDDGGLEIKRVRVSFADFRGISAANPGSEIAFVSLYRITQDINNPLFDFENEFNLAQNILLARERVVGSNVILNVPCEELAERLPPYDMPCDPNINPVSGVTRLYSGGDGYVLNSTAIFMVAVETDATIDNNDQFSVIVRIQREDIAHQTGSGSPFGTRVFGSRIITVVDQAGDVMPFPDVILGGAVDRFYPFEPHNYPDLFSQHPDALNILEDMEVPQVFPSESSRTAVIGFEIAGVHSYLNYVILNFTSCREGRNNDGDYWADDPAGIPGVYDPFVDEIFRNLGEIADDGDPKIFEYDTFDQVVFEGLTPGVQTTRRGFDDDGDGRIDEELPNGLDDDDDGLTDEDISLPVIHPLVDEDNQDYWAWHDENGNGVYDPAIDELYFDANGNGVFDPTSGIPQVNEVPERVYRGATAGFVLRPGQPYDNFAGTGVDNTGDGTPDTFFFRLDDDGDGEDGSPLSPNIFGLVPALTSPPPPDNAFVRNPYFQNWPDADGTQDIGNPSVFAGVKMADGLDNDHDSDDWKDTDGIPGMSIGDEGVKEDPANPGMPIVYADGVDNDGDGEAESPRDAQGRAMADGIDNDEDGLVDEGIDENVDEGINEDLGDNAFNAITTRRNSFNTFDDYLGDIDSVILYQDNGDGLFDPAADTPVSRHDPEEIHWTWLDNTPPVMSMAVFTDSTINNGRGPRVPVTDDGTYDFFVAITIDGDDRGDYFQPGARVPNPSNVEEGIILLDYEGARPGDDFMVSIARGSTPAFAAFGFSSGIGTDAGYPNASKLTKPAECKLFIEDIIGYIPDTTQGDNSLGFVVDRPEQVPIGSDDDIFVGNPYLDSTSSPVGVIGIDVADNPYSDDDEQDYIDSITVRIQSLTHDLVSRDIEFEGTFDITNSGGVIGLPDLMPLADDSTGGVGIYRDNPEAGIPGGFDSADLPVELRSDFLQYSLVAGTTDTVQVTLRPTDGLVIPPEDFTGENVGYDYYVVVRTSSSVDYRDAFRITIRDGGVLFRSGPSVQNSGVSTDSIVANVPVIHQNLVAGSPEPIPANIPTEESGIAVIGFNIYDRSLADNGRPTNMEYLLVNFANVGGDSQFTIEDLAPIGTGPNNVILKTDGVALYRDSPASAGPDSKPGIFDRTDQLVRAVPLIGNVDGFPNSVYLFFDPFGDDPLGDYQDTDGDLNFAEEDGVIGERIPPDDLGDNQGNDYFVVIRPDADISNGDDFIVQVRPLVNNDVVEWPIRFLPDENFPTQHFLSADALGAPVGTTVDIFHEVNGVFRQDFSFEAIDSNVLQAFTQTDTVFSDLTVINDTIEAAGDPKAMVGININDQGGPQRTISRLSFEVRSPLVAGPNMPSATTADFNPFSPTPNSGFALYMDNTNVGIQGVFDAADTFVSLSPSGSSAVQNGNVINVDITFSPGVPVPDNDSGQNAGPDFFLVLRTSNHISFRDQFQVYIRESGITFESGPSFGNASVLTNLVTTNVPVFATDTTGFFGASFDRNDGPEDVIGLNFITATKANPNTSNESLVSLYVALTKVGDSAFTNSDLAPLSATPASGVALYLDNGTINGRFDEADTFIPLQNNPFYTSENEVFLRVATPVPLPARDDFVPGTDFGPDIYVVLRTSGSISQDSVFSVTVKNIRYLTTTSNLIFTTGPIDGGDVNEPPFLEIVTPILGNTANQLFTLRWEDFDPDSNAGIDFFFVADSAYLANGFSFDGLVRNEILASDAMTSAVGLPEDPDGAADSFAWDVSLINTSLFDPPDPRVAELRVGGVITDGIADFTDASPSFLTVTNSAPSLKFKPVSGSGIVAGNPPSVLEGIPFNVGCTAGDPEGRGQADVFLIDETQLAVLSTPQAQVLFARNTETANGADIAALSPGNIFWVNEGQVLAVTQSSTFALTVGPSLSNQMISGAPRTFVALAHVRDIVGGSREMDDAAQPVAQLVRVRITPNSPPSFAFAGDLAGGATALEVDGDNRFQINWTDSEPDPGSNARIKLEFAAGMISNPTQIVQGFLPGSPGGTPVPALNIAQTGPDSFTWEMSSLAPGLYALQGVIADEISRDTDLAYVYLNRPSTFSFVEPDTDVSLFLGESLEIRWNDQGGAQPDDDEQVRFFLRNIVTLADIQLNTAINLSASPNILQVLTGSVAGLVEGTYNLYAVVEPPASNNPLNYSRQIFAREVDNSLVQITFTENDPPQLDFSSLSLADVVNANPDVTDPTMGGVVADGAAEIPVVWDDFDDAPFTATVKLYYATDTSDVSARREMQGTYPPVFNTVSAPNLDMATDNGPGPYPARGAFSIGAASDVFFWDISDPISVPRGTYSAIAVLDDGINPQVVRTSPNSITINRRPNIQLLSASPGTVTRGDNVTLSWTDSDPDSNATIRLYYRIDEDLNGTPDTPATLIAAASNLAEDPDGPAGDQFVFDTGLIDPFPTTSFGLFLVAEIRDEVNVDSDSIPVIGGVVVNPNDPPSMQLVRPNLADQMDDVTGTIHVYPDRLSRLGVNPPLFPITWANGADDNVGTTFALFFDNDRFGADGTAINQTDPITLLDSNAIPLTNSGVFNWDVRDYPDIPPGDYYVYALLNDGVNPPEAVYSDAFIRINQPATFSFLEPDGFNDSVFRGEAYTLAWTDSDPDSAAFINLFLDNDNDLTNGFGTNVADLNALDLGLGIPEDDETDRLAVNTELLPPGNYTVVARIDDGVNIPLLFQSANPLTILESGGPPTIQITQPAGGSPSDPFVVTTPTMLITWTDSDIPERLVEQSFIRFYWDTDFFGVNGTVVSGTDVAFDGSVFSGDRVPVELRVSDPNFPAALKDQDQFEVGIDQFPKGVVLYLYAVITDTGAIQQDAQGHFLQGRPSSEFYSSNAFIINSSPTFRWIVPSDQPGDLFHPVNPRGNPLTITYEARDPDSVAVIDLFLDTDTNSADGLVPVESPGQNLLEADGVSALDLNLADEVSAASVPQVYRLLARITDGVTATEVYSGTFTVIENIAPTLAILQPSVETIVPMTGTYEVIWTDEDPDSNASIKAFLDFDTVGGNGPVIPGTYTTTFSVNLTGLNIPEDEDNFSLGRDRFIWDLSKTSPGSYYVGLRAYDGANTTVVYSGARVIVNSPPELFWINPPEQGAHVVQGNAFNLQWSDEDDDAATLITFYLDRDAISFNGNEIPVPQGVVLLQDTADNLSFNSAIVPIPEGAPNVVVTPLAVLNDGVNPQVIVRSPGSITIDFNDPPRIDVLEPKQETVLFDNLFTLVWTDSDPDSSAVIDFFLDTDKTGADGTPISSAQDIPEDDEVDSLEVDFSGTPPGRYWIYAVIDDGYNRPYSDYAPAPINILSGTETVEYAVFMLSRFGDVFSVGDVRYRFNGITGGTQDLYRSVALSLDGTTLVRLRSDGQVDQYGFQKVVLTPVPPPMGEYIDIEFTPSNRGLWLLDSFGNIATIGDATPFLEGMGAMGLFGMPIARDFEPTKDGRGGYILDGNGGVHAVGNAINFNEFPFFGFDIARDIELDSQGGYVLDGLGDVFPLGRSPDLSPGADFDYDIARDLLVFEKGGFYILDGMGGITALGNKAIIAPTNEPAPDPYFPGMDVIRDFALAGTVELTDEALLAMSTVRKFEVAFRNEDLESLIPTISTSYNDGLHLSRTQLIEGTFDIPTGAKIANGILDEWDATRDLFGGPLAGFALLDPLVTFSEDGNTAFVSVTARRTGYRGSETSTEVTVPPDPPVLVTFEVEERDAVGASLLLFSPIPTDLRMADPGDHRGVILYIDKAFADVFGEFPDGLEFSEDFEYNFRSQGSESFRTTLPGGAVCRFVFATALDNLPEFFPPDPRPVTFTYTEYEQLTDISLVFTVRREGPREWAIVNIDPITSLVPGP
ncbi:MAG: hypothetical protein HUU16_00795 [Candidatus Omnitrophica bacterium]|nr:hypothetical protein [Candidatus Omnitrophota bacterium]